MIEELKELEQYITQQTTPLEVEEALEELGNFKTNTGIVETDRVVRGYVRDLKSYDIIKSALASKQNREQLKNEIIEEYQELLKLEILLGRHHQYYVCKEYYDKNENEDVRCDLKRLRELRAKHIDIKSLLEEDTK